MERKSEKKDEVRKGKGKKIKDTKRQSGRWGSEEIRREGGLPRAHMGHSKATLMIFKSMLNTHLIAIHHSSR